MAFPSGLEYRSANGFTSSGGDFSVIFGRISLAEGNLSVVEAYDRLLFP